MADPGKWAEKSKGHIQLGKEGPCYSRREQTGSKDTGLVEKQVEGKVNLPSYNENSFIIRF